jgi:antitoxin HicB
MPHAYPVALDQEADGSAVNLSFPDVPGARTFGENDGEALALAEDCLIAALGGYIELGKPIPTPGPALGRPTVTLGPLIAAKIALYETMRQQGISIPELARRLDAPEQAVRRLIDLDRRSSLEELQTALDCLGKRIELVVHDAA